MNWVTVIWSLNAGVCLALAGMLLLVWAKSRDSWASLLFAVAATSGAACAAVELALMSSRTPEQYGQLMRLWQVPIGVMAISVVWFVRLYLGQGRLWLAWLITVLRVLVLVLTFSFEPNLNFREITSLDEFSLWGETVVLPIGVPNPWTNITSFSSLLLLVFAVDAAFAAWRKGHRRRAWAVGLPLAIGTAAGFAEGLLLSLRMFPLPLTVSFPFLIFLIGFAYELGMDLARAGALSRQLQASQERMRLAARGASVGIWEWLVDRDELWVAGADQTGSDRRTIEPGALERILQRVHPDDREPLRQTVRDALKSGRDFETEYRESDPGGTIRWTAARGEVVRADGSEATLLRGVTLDVTKRKLAELALQESARFNERVLSSLHHEIAILDRDGWIVAVNDAWKASEQREGGDAGGVGTDYLNTCRVAASSGEASAARVLDGIESVLRSNRDAFEMECAFGSRKRNAASLMRAVPLKTSEGGAVISYVDITELKRAEREMGELRNDLAHMSRVSTMGLLASALAHELSQPLGAILRNAEAGELFIARSPPDYDEIKSILSDIKHDDQRATAVIDRMRALLKRRKPTAGRLSVKELLEQVVTLARAECQARNAVVRMDVPDDLPRAQGDRIQLQQVALNLLMNALDAMEGTPPERRMVVVTACRVDEHFVEVSVSDAGSGIAAGQESRIFEPFHSTKSHGLGMGLAISRAIVEAHGGRIWAQRNAAGGATIRYTLKIAEPA